MWLQLCCMGGQHLAVALMAGHCLGRDWACAPLCGVSVCAPVYGIYTCVSTFVQSEHMCVECARECVPLCVSLLISFYRLSRASPMMSSSTHHHLPNTKPCPKHHNQLKLPLCFSNRGIHFNLCEHGIAQNHSTSYYFRCSKIPLDLRQEPVRLWGCVFVLQAIVCFILSENYLI